MALGITPKTKEPERVCGGPEQQQGNDDGNKQLILLA